MFKIHCFNLERSYQSQNSSAVVYFGQPVIIGLQSQAILIQQQKSCVSPRTLVFLTACLLLTWISSPL